MSSYRSLVFVFFFFKRKTAYEMRISDWSSDVCSSDLRRGLFGRVGRAGSEEASGRGASVGLGLNASSSFDRLSAILCRHHALNLELLLGRERQQLVGRLSDLEGAVGALAAGDDRRQSLCIRTDVPHDLRLDAERVAEGRPGGIEASVRCGDGVRGV